MLAACNSAVNSGSRTLNVPIVISTVGLSHSNPLSIATKQ